MTAERRVAGVDRKNTIDESHYGLGRTREPCQGAGLFEIPRGTTG